MKVTGKTSITTTTTVKGEIDHTELAQLIGATLHIPEGAELRIFVDVPGGGDWRDLDIRENPVRFEITFSEEREHDLKEPPLRVPEQAPVCSQSGCQFPSLSGGLCASHLSQAYRAQNTATQISAEQLAGLGRRYPR